MIKLKVEGLAKVSREIDQARRKLRLSGAAFADLAAGVVRDTVVRNAQPFGTGKKALEQGRKAVRGDLLKVFQPVGDGARVRGGTITGRAEAKRWHQSRRGKNGRTSRGKTRPILASVFYGYLAEVQGKVGMAKGALMGGDDSRLKGRFGKWMKRHKRAGGAKRKRGVGGATWKFRAEPKHVASPRVMGARGVARVLNQKEKNLARVMNRKVKRLLKRTSGRVNRK